MNTDLTVFERTLTLHRFPKLPNETLQAWDAGDEYLIRHIEDQQLSDNQNILILNDHFGALSCWFSLKHHVTALSDSFVAQQGAKANLAHNQCHDVTLLKSTAPWPEKPDLILMQIPRNNRYLSWQLDSIRHLYGSGCPVIAVNKAKEIHTSTLKLFEKYLGTTTTSLAWKKHRLVFSQADCSQAGDDAISDATESDAIEAAKIDPYTRWSVDDHGLTLANLPNVYSGESLDLGARLLLQHLPSDDRYQQILDLGCGNGVLSLKLMQLNPQAHVTSVDESYMAVKSVQTNVELNQLDPAHLNAVANNCLDNFEADSQDLVVCNPPFHQQQAITDHIAWQMFCDAKQVLRSKGELLVIGNRHLGYDKKLSRLFGRSGVKLVASNAKFVILQAIK
ncbi:methyltransferase [Vibrio hippocampi]|uniref:Ribosomal RNA large subunit methyltransferase G n=1 Tax=Vibrio hippocampi TaxID=654686 RepID=A0ABN8DME5_9VIBR|nr:methyltransferase [Vibrio hippocampi]CAH0526722.1 Ribosomal RNA large subunit methyltransferase G [Vibrio hippocampi]